MPFFAEKLSFPKAFLGDNELGQITEHGNELEARAEADGKEKVRERRVMGISPSFPAPPLVLIILKISFFVISNECCMRMQTEIHSGKMFLTQCFLIFGDLYQSLIVSVTFPSPQSGLLNSRCTYTPRTDYKYFSASLAVTTLKVKLFQVALFIAEYKF